MSAAYEALVRFGSFGQFDRFYRAVAGELDESPGATILDLGCGPGTLTPYLLEKVGPAGRVIGVDVADGMVARARSRAARSGWHNVEFERSDALDYSPRSRVRLEAPLVGARPTGLPLDFVFGNLEGARMRRFFLGVYTLLSARKPAAA